MNYLKKRALATVPHAPGWWFRYVDDTHCKIQRCHAQEFTDHLNSLDSDIKFTTEAEEDNSIASLDTLSIRQPNGQLKVKIYRKPTHTEQYLIFESNHPLQYKLRVIRTLFHRAESIITDKEGLEEEIARVSTALQKCDYPKWALDRIKQTVHTAHESSTSVVKIREKSKGVVIIPYIKGLSETLKRIFAAKGIQTCFKPTNTLRQVLVAPKDKSKKEDTVNPIYLIACASCNDSYIGETEQVLKTRFNEHRPLVHQGARKWPITFIRPALTIPSPYNKPKCWTETLGGSKEVSKRRFTSGPYNHHLTRTGALPTSTDLHQDRQSIGAL